MNSLEPIDRLNTIDAAIALCDDNIKRHNLSALTTLIAGGLLLLIVVALAGASADLTEKGTENQRLNLLNDVLQKQRAFENVTNEIGPFRSEPNAAKDRLTILEKSKPADNAPDEDVKKWQALKDETTTQLSEAEKALLEKSNSTRAELEAAKAALAKYTPAPLISKELMLGFVGLSVLIFSVFTGMYRFHQKEIAKNEHHKLGFTRIRIAANNADREGFKDEVRTALTLNAFSVPADSLFGNKEKTVESPVPGHPTSDLAAGIVNKLLEQVEIVLQPKAK